MKRWFIMTHRNWRYYIIYIQYLTVQMNTLLPHSKQTNQTPPLAAESVRVACWCESQQLAFVVIQKITELNIFECILLNFNVGTVISGLTVRRTGVWILGGSGWPKVVVRRIHEKKIVHPTSCHLGRNKVWTRKQGTAKSLTAPILHHSDHDDQSNFTLIHIQYWSTDSRLLLFKYK